MPRNTCRPSECVANGNSNSNGSGNGNINGNGDKANGNQDDSTASATTDGGGGTGAAATTASAAGVTREVAAIVKQEFEAAPSVGHRKSERRKIARDIFLVFEEQPTRRRRGRGGARGKCTRAKQKFGHLKVANTPRINKNILREIKTEPKCSTAAIATITEAAAATTTVAAAAAAAATTIAADEAAATSNEEMPAAKAAAEIVREPEKPKVEMAKVKLETKTASNAIATLTAATTATKAAAAVAATVMTAATVTTATTATKATTAVVSAELQLPTAATTTTTTTNPAATSTTTTAATTPSVNPIFLWVKQDDTRIVEVRCEDYDKRNRIRLTKTTNGWRSMPRTDASSSRIVKFFHSTGAAAVAAAAGEAAEATPKLLQVKREQLQQQQSIEQEQEQQHVEQQHWTAVEQQQRQLEEQQEQQEQQEEREAQQQQQQQAAVIEQVVVVVPAQQQQQQPQLEEQLDSTLLPATQDVSFDALLDSETNASTKATKTSTNSNPTTPTYQSCCSPTPTATATAPTTPSPAPTATAPTTPSPTPLELQLCPKTGLFLPQGVVALPLQHTDEATDNARALDEEQQQQHQQQQQQQSKPSNDCSSLLDAQTKNLKDLLDDADELLQQCSSDNGSNGDDLLDSLVKRSCEDNLTAAAASAGGGGAAAAVGGGGAAAAAAAAAGLSSFCVPDVAGKELPSILGMHMDMDSSSDDAPKCLSFNEAGEIEGLNGDLFLSMDAFDKPPAEAEANTVLHKEAEQQPLQLETTPPRLLDETPKDLSYKKREEVCPPSESRSQCAVTSSSDILKCKSPEPELLQLPAAPSIPAEVETTSETIKHLILEQFLKLNGSTQQQAEPMDLGKATTGRGAGVGVGAAAGVGAGDTVVIDDEDGEAEQLARQRDGGEPTEPLKKRAKAIKMDKDPDPLTQLKMLIGNPQWKVPDPILVPKDRLGAVLASPAREIPLLLTTRPELRLPEAFAYPEIIQNPNILVVTMEQLEAILKNNADQAKATTTTTTKASDATPTAPSSSPVSISGCLPASLPSSKVTSPLKQPQVKSLPAKSFCSNSATACSSASATPTPTTAGAGAAGPASCSPAADSSMSTELNATTLALLQQMLWLPYFGQLSQEFFKTLKDPLGLQRKFMSNLLPLYQSQFGLQHLDELYKHCLKQKPSAQDDAVPPTAAAAAVTPTPAAAAAAPAKPAAFNGFSNSMELAFMQKLLQQQQQQQQQQVKESSQQQQQQQHHYLEHKRARRDVDATSLHVADLSKPPTKCTTAATVAAVPAAANTAATAAVVPTPATEHKPRLTCKSLSNLLEPESNVVPLLNVPFDAVRRLGVMHKPTQEPSSGRTLRSSKACVTYNPLEQAKQSQQQQQQQQQQLQRKRGNMLAHEVQHQQQHLAEAAAAAAAGGGGGAAAAAGGMAGMDSALWHPLFGNNPKQGYNSPWQWTTVTATGE